MGVTTDNIANEPLAWWKVEFSIKTSEENSDYLSEDDLAAMLFEYGVSSVEIVNFHTLSGLFNLSKDALDTALEAISTSGNYTLKNITLVEEKNWTQGSQELFEEIQARRFKIKPLVSIDSPHPEEADTLYIIPGAGFGTGHHQTTKMITNVMQDLKYAPKSILDMGTGSGILAIAGQKLWPSAEVLGFDNDPLAVNNARENCLINKIDSVKLEVKDLKTFFKDSVKNYEQLRYELIIANLYAELLIEYSKNILNSLLPASDLILSGILKEKVFEVKNSFQDIRFNSINEVADGDWVCLHYKGI